MALPSAGPGRILRPRRKRAVAGSWSSERERRRALGRSAAVTSAGSRVGRSGASSASRVSVPDLNVGAPVISIAERVSSLAKNPIVQFRLPLLTEHRGTPAAALQHLS